jgi:hypothetical protein
MTFFCNPQIEFRVFQAAETTISEQQPKSQTPESFMKHFPRSALAVTVAALAVSVATYAGTPPPGYVEFGELPAPGNGGQFVEVNIKSNLIAMVARLVEKEESEAAELLRGLHQVRVNVIGLTDENRADLEKRIKSIRAQLDSQGWERIVTAQQKDEDVGVYLKTRGDQAVEGLVVTVLSGSKEAVLVNIVGNIRPEKVAEVGERLNIEPLKKLAPKKAEKE